MEVNNKQPGGPDPARKRQALDPSVGANNRLDEAQASERQNLRGPRTERPERGAKGDVLQLSHGVHNDQASPAREARLRALSEAFREGLLNSTERIARAAEKILLG